MNERQNKELDETLTAEKARQSSVNVGAANLDAFSDRVKVLIRAAGSAAEIARTCGFSEAVVRSWRDGLSDPSRERCLALAKGTGASVLWLVTGAGPIWTRELPQNEQDTLTIALGDPGSAEVLAAEARRTAAIAGFSAGVKATQHPDGTTIARSGPLDESALLQALQLVDEALDGRKIPRNRRAELVGHVYALVIAPGELPSGTITQLIRAAATGVDDGRQQDRQDSTDPARRSGGGGG